MSTVWVRRMTNMQPACAACSGWSLPALFPKKLDTKAKGSREIFSPQKKKNAKGHLKKMQYYRDIYDEVVK